MRWLIITLFSCYSCIAFATEKNTPTMDDIQTLGPSIYDVKGMGSWQKGSRSGQVRLVIARMKKQDDVFLQWVQWNDKGPELVKSTVKIKEIQQQGRYQVDFIRRETIGHSRQIVLGLENLHDKSSTRVVIQVQDLGVYTFKFEQP